MGEDINKGQGPVNLDLDAGMFRSSDKAPEKTFITMQRRLSGILENSPASFTDVDGLALFGGDIVLATAEEARATTAAKGIGISGEGYRWPDGIVPYVTVEALASIVANAIAHWEKHTPIRFRPRTNETAHVSFEQRGGWFSRVGRQGTKQVISLGDNERVGSAVHEIGHALGLWHEQSRSDRDQYIKVIEENIIPKDLHNFAKHVLDGTDLGSYDYGSIMHYPAKAFSKNNLPTIVAASGESIGQRNGLSKGDILAVKLMYPKLDWTGYV